MTAFSQSKQAAEAAPTPGRGPDFPTFWPWLSLGRFLLASIVVFTHIGEFDGKSIIRILGAGSFEAIAGFLVISGFSIAYSYTTKPDGYLKRRVQRIYPIYLFAFAVAIVNILLGGGAMFSPFVIVANLLFLNGFITAVAVVGPAWTLAIEIWLYVLAPTLARLSTRVITRWAGVSFGCYVLYTVGETEFRWNYYSGTSFGIGLICLAFFWLLGWQLATATGTSRTLVKRILCLTFIAHVALRFSIEAAHLFKHHEMAEIVKWVPLNLEGVVVLALVFVFFRRDSLPAINPRLSTFFYFLGDISYPLYLLHLSIFSILARVGYTSWYVLAGASLVASAFAYLVVDQYSRKRPHKRAVVAPG